MASNKPYDPNRVPEHLSQLIANKLETPLVNRATQGLYPPGSTFKVVTAAAGLDSGTITPETTIDAPGTLDVEGQPLQNDFNQNFGPDLPRHGADQLGQHLVRPARPEGRPGHAVRNDGKVRLQLDPADRPARRRRRKRGREKRCVHWRRTARHDPVDLARVAIGQERLAATPLQMAEVAAAVANGGKLMKPQIWNGSSTPTAAWSSASTPPNTASRSAPRRRQS